MKFREITKKTNIDFIGLRNKAFILSFVLVALGLFGFIMVSIGKANLSVDFTGGTSVQVRFTQPIGIGDLRAALTQGGIEDVQIQQVTGSQIQQAAGQNDFIIKTQLQQAGTERAQDRISAVISKAFPGNKFQVLGSDMVGPSVGKTLKSHAILAIILSLIGIVIYIAWRFNFVFGVAATIATFHDVLALLGIFFVLHFEMNILFITALLTVAGYSLTDTVVVYDRIRENMAKMKAKSDVGQVINVSINEVLSRTLITSLTVLLVLAALLVIGGHVLFDFAFALFIGVLVGTYSSIFVASPLIYLWRRRA
jgi:preprotein translocase subunit SecF